MNVFPPYVIGTLIFDNVALKAGGSSTDNTAYNRHCMQRVNSDYQDVPDGSAGKDHTILGKGPCGTTFLMRVKETGRLVALKQLSET